MKDDFQDTKMTSARELNMCQLMDQVFRKIYLIQLKDDTDNNMGPLANIGHCEGRQCVCVWWGSKYI